MAQQIYGLFVIKEFDYGIDNESVILASVNKALLDIICEEKNMKLKIHNEHNKQENAKLDKWRNLNKLFYNPKISIEQDKKDFQEHCRKFEEFYETLNFSREFFNEKSFEVKEIPTA